MTKTNGQEYWHIDFIQHCRKTGKDQRLGIVVKATDEEHARQNAERELNSIFIDKWTIVSVTEDRFWRRDKK